MSEERNRDSSTKESAKRLPRRKFIIGGATVVAGGLLAACAPKAPEPTATSVPKVATPTAIPQVVATPGISRPAPQGTLIFCTGQAFTGNWMPMQHITLSIWRVENLVYNNLVRYTPDGQVLPALAVEHKVTPDGLEFTLRRDVKYHDGQSFTAADVLYSLDLILDPKNMRSGFFPQDLKYLAPDDYSVKVETKYPIWALAQIGGLMPIVSKEDSPEALTATQNGTGPFKRVKYEGETVYLEANSDSFVGVPLLKEVRMPYVADSTTRLAALQRGEVHIIDRILGDQMPTVMRDQNLVVDPVLSTEMFYLAFKTTNGVMQNPLLRRAIAHCIDREGIVEGIMRGYGDVSDSFNVKTVWPYGAEAPAPNFPQYDLELAKQALAEAGYPNGEGLPELLCIGACGYHPNSKEYLEYIAAQCGKVGIPIKVECWETAKWVSGLYGHESCHMINLGFTNVTPEPNTVLRFSFYTRGRHNDFSHPDVDAAFDYMDEAKDATERAKRMRENLMPALVDHMPSAPMFTSYNILGINKKVKGFKMMPTMLFDLMDVSVEA